MIRHIVFFTLKPEIDPGFVVHNLERLGTIPGSKVFEVRRNQRVDQFGNDIEIVVYAEFPDIEALHTYKRHPTYSDVTATVRPLRNLRHAVDIES